MAEKQPLSGVARSPLPPCERELFIDTLLVGGFPEAEARSTPRRREAWFDSYLQAVLQRDVRELAHLEQLTEMPNLVQLLAHRSASLLNFAELSRSSGLAQTTLKRYFTLLETLFLVQRIPAWERNPAKRLVKTPKIFLPHSACSPICAATTPPPSPPPRACRAIWSRPSSLPNFSSISPFRRAACRYGITAPRPASKSTSCSKTARAA